METTLLALITVTLLQLGPQDLLEPPQPSSSFSWVDLDRDGDQDALAVEPPGVLRLLRNQGDGTFVDATAAAGLADLAGASSALLGDYDLDGEADLVVLVEGGVQLLRQVGGSFIDVTDTTGLEGLGAVSSAAWVHADTDRRPDLYLAGNGTHRLFGNQASGLFRELDLGLASAPGALTVSSTGGAAPSGETTGALAPIGRRERPGREGPRGRSSGGGSSPATGPTVVITPTGTGQLPMAGPPSLICAGSLVDQAGTGCLEASTTPTEGLLYPLSQYLFVASPSGRVGINTLNPAGRLHVVGGNPNFTRSIFAPLGVDANGCSAIELLRHERSGTTRMGMELEFDGPNDRFELNALTSSPDGEPTFSMPHLTIERLTRQVGIGTDDPRARLHVAGGLLVSNEGTTPGDAALYLSSKESNLDPGAKLMYDESEVEFQIHLPNAGIYTPRLTVQNDGLGDTSVGIGTTDPQGELHVSGDATATVLVTPDSSGGSSEVFLAENTAGTNGMRVLYSGADNQLQIYGENGGTVTGPHMVTNRSNGRVGIGTVDPQGELHVSGDSTASVFLTPGSAGGSSEVFLAENTAGTNGMSFLYSGPDNQLQIYGENGGTLSGPHMIVNRSNGHVGIAGDGDTAVTYADSALTVTGKTTTDVLTIRGGSDLVEGFDTVEETCEPGTVVVIDPEHPGRLTASTTAYDRKVAGVVSGAGDLRPGLHMGQEGVADGDTLVAMTGRVYVKCSAENGTIRPGDLLTTSSLAGHAMRADDPERSFGTVIGKAMSSLDDGTGLVLVLVNLQ